MAVRSRDRVRIVFFLSRRQFKVALAIGGLLGLAYGLESATMKFSTSYPAPSGAYKKLSSETLELRGLDADPSGTDGTIYYNRPSREFRGYRGQWGPLGGGAPSGAVVLFNLDACPAGWSPYGAARGRYLVGASAGAAAGTTVGRPLRDREDRAVGAHRHRMVAPGNPRPLITSQPIMLRDAYNPQNIAYFRGQYFYDNSANHFVGMHAPTADMVESPEPAAQGAAGDSAGTNAPYVQLTACVKN